MTSERNAEVVRGHVMDRRRFVDGVAAVCALGALSLAGCAGQSTAAPKTVVYCLEAGPDVYSIGAYVARARGYLASDGLELQIVSPDDGSTALEMVNAGKAQLGLSSQEALAGAFAVEEPASVIAVAAVTQHDMTTEVRPALPRTGGYAKRDSYSAVVIANDAYLVNYADEARAAVDALRRGYELTASEPASAARVLCEQAGGALDEKRATAAARLLAPQLLDAKGRWGRISQKRWDGFFSWLLEKGTIDRTIPAHHGYTLDYLRSSRSSGRTGEKGE